MPPTLGWELCARKTMKVSSTPVLTTVTPAEHNYEVGDLGTPSRNACLAGVVALARRNFKNIHRLDRSQEPAYLQSANWLNARQATWALFFTCFNFSNTYRPCSRNIKPDGLSRQFSTSEDTPKNPGFSHVPASWER